MVGWLFRNVSALRVGVAKPVSVCGWVNRVADRLAVQNMIACGWVNRVVDRLAVQKHECLEGRGGKTSQCLWVGKHGG